ncbi:MAG: hypothetical protein KDD37_11375 [Bdellovibrionales bacterium]|nr:hypothetical protein [Bdellovibrionales bacterium]
MFKAILEIIPEAVIAIVGFFVGTWKEKRSLTKNEDSKSLESLLDSLPSFSTIEFYYVEKNLIDSFNSNIFHQFNDAFSRVISDPTSAFIDKELQDLAVEINVLSKDFINCIIIDTFPTGNGEQTIRRTKLGDDYDDLKTGNFLNETATKIFEKYKLFLSSAKRKGIVQKRNDNSKKI